MKKYTILFFAIVFTACSNRHDITGKWKLMDIELKGLQEVQKKAMIGNVTMEFRKDSVCIVTADDGGRNEGKYSYDRKNRIITTRSHFGGVQPAKVLELDAKNMTLLIDSMKLIMKRE